jgi:hypothetical protein
MIKLTLLLDEKTIQKAKKLAKKNKTSVSRMAADYFESMGESEKKDEFNDLPVLKEFAGMLYGKGTPQSAKKDYAKHIRNKYK